MPAEGNFEKTRIQDPDKAHEEANMLRVEAGENPTPEDYDKALYELESLQKAIEEQSTPESIDKAIRIFVAGAGVAVERTPRLLAAAALNILPYPAAFKEKTREQLGGGVIDQLKGIGKDYEKMRALFQTAREELEQWKAEAEKETTK